MLLKGKEVYYTILSILQNCENQALICEQLNYILWLSAPLDSNRSKEQKVHD